MMNRIDVRHLLAATLLHAACGDSSGDGAGGASSAATGAPSSTTAGSTSATSTSSTTGGGDGGASATSTTSSDGTGGVGGSSGPSPEACFAIHDEEQCFAAGCDMFNAGAHTFTIVDGVCEASDEVGYCFRLDIAAGSPLAVTIFREFAAEGPQVLGMHTTYSIEGWRTCETSDEEAAPECCCYGGCEGVTPVDPFE